MSISNTTDEIVAAMADSSTSTPSLSAARHAIFHFFDFIALLIGLISTIVLWVASLIFTASLGGGALLLARYYFGYKDRCQEGKSWQNGEPPSAFWAGFWPTGVFQVAFLIYLANVVEDLMVLEMLGYSIVAVIASLGVMLVFVLVVAGTWKILTAVCHRGGRESVVQEAESESAGEKV